MVIQTAPSRRPWGVDRVPASDDDKAEFRAEHVPGSKEYKERNGG